MVHYQVPVLHLNSILALRKDVILSSHVENVWLIQDADGVINRLVLVVSQPRIVWIEGCVSLKSSTIQPVLHSKHVHPIQDHQSQQHLDRYRNG